MVTLTLVVLLSGMVAEPGQASSITLLCRQGWIVDFYPDGQVHAQWGSLPGDGASTPKRTVRFDALLAALERLRVERRIDGGTQVAVLRERETTTTAFYVSDDTLFRYLVASFSDKWTQDAGGTRFHELLKMHPICPGD